MKVLRILSRTVACLLYIVVFQCTCYSADAFDRFVMPADVALSKENAQLIGRLAQNDQVDATISLGLRNPAQLQIFLQKIQDPANPAYDHYLTPSQFTAQFGPTEAEYDSVEKYAQAEGLVITNTHVNRLLLDVRGSRDAVEQAFGVHLYWFRSINGEEFHAPDQAPSIPKSLMSVVAGVEGLNNSAVRQPANLLKFNDYGLLISGIGTGPQGGLTPSNIKAAYNLASVNLNGSGQTLAVFELGGYTPSDINTYESQFSLPKVALQNILVDGATGVPGKGESEVTLDIELQIALAPSAAKLFVYETPNTDTGILDGYSRIAEDDLAKEISTSWGLAEEQNNESFLKSENSIFQQMAAQGQTMYAAAGDFGAYDLGSIQSGVSVDDPGSQPYVCCAGGTTLATQYNGGPWESETTWNSGTTKNGAGGGGISTIWPIPSWQTAAINTSSKASSTKRNVPDISIDANPDTGYSIFDDGSWTVYGGTSCAGPLWAGLTALVNQQRESSGQADIGQASPALYPLLSSGAYSGDFHDIADGSTNLFYSAVSGYDDATGLGTPNGANLVKALAPVANSSVPSAPTGLTATAGNASVVLTWDVVSAATSYNVYRSTQSNAGFIAVANIGQSTYTDSNTVNATTYYYYVTAVDSGGESSASNEVSAIPSAPVTKPTAPTGLTATAGNASVSLVWSPSSGATSYNIYRSFTNGSGFVIIGSSTTTSYKDSSAANGTTYYYVIAAVNSAGQSSFSNQVSATPDTTITSPNPPSGLIATDGNGSVELMWSASNSANSYTVYRSVNSGSGFAIIGTSTTSSYSDSSLTAGITYYYAVTVVNTSGESGFSNIASATPYMNIASFPAGINFISLPYDYSTASLSTLFGYTNPLLAVWNSESLIYVLSPNLPSDHVRLGTGYWARFPNPVTVTILGTSAPTTSAFSINLQQGWNQIGDPFVADIPLASDNIQISGQTISYATAVSSGVIGKLIYKYNAATQTYLSVDQAGSLEPGSGYFIYVSQALTLNVNPS